MLDDFGLIHMNGRIYDPEIGRFLSCDPYVQVPEFSQNFNRYTYVLNNPLTLTDPSGHNWVGIMFGGIYVDVAKNNPRIAEIGNLIITIAITHTAGPTIGGAIGGALNAYTSGGTTGDVIRGAAVGAAQGYISGNFLHGLGEAASAARSGIVSGQSSVLQATVLTAEHVAGHAILGGIASAAMGGKFQDGFLSAGLSTLAFGMGISEKLNLGESGDWSDAGKVFGRTVVAGIIGGTASAIGGGKFANGAWTAAFQHFANEEGGIDWSKWSESHFNDGQIRIDSNVYGSKSEGLRSWKIQMHVGENNEEFIYNPSMGKFLNEAGQEIPKKYRVMLQKSPGLLKGLTKAIDRVNRAGANIVRAGGVLALLAPLGLLSMSNPSSELGQAIDSYKSNVERDNASGIISSAQEIVEKSGIVSDSLQTLLYCKLTEVAD
jgi:RHS repeat-associated protein